MLLADLGAEVIKVESPAGDDTRSWMPPVTEVGVSSDFLAINTVPVTWPGGNPATNGTYHHLLPFCSSTRRCSRARVCRTSGLARQRRSYPSKTPNRA
jgi:hypothetical protein